MEPKDVSLSGVQFAGSTLRPPGHVCAFFRDPDEEQAVLAPYTTDQLRAGDRVLYVIDPKLRGLRLEQLQKGGIDVQDALRAGRLQLIPWEELLLRNGAFDPEEAIVRIQKLLEAAKSAGFPRSHLIVDMTWVCTKSPGVERFLEIENALNKLLLRSSDAVICVYNLQKVDAELVIDVVRTHPMMIVNGIVEEHPFFTPPEEFLRARRNGKGVERRTPSRQARDGPVDVAAIPPEELRACIRDLLATLVLPGSWRGRSFEQIVQALLEVLGALVPLEFAYGRVGTETGPKTVYLYRNGRIQSSSDATEWTRKLEQLRAERRPSPIQNPFGEGTLTAVLVPLGIQAKWGTIVVASTADGFPTATEQVLLGAAANQAVLALDEAYARSLEEAKSRAEAEHLKATADLARLRAQFEPHYLLNALNTISGLVTADPLQARQLLVYFGDLLRDSLQSSGDQETLGEQIDWLRSYAAILEARHAGRLKFRWQVPKEARSVLVLRLLLQPLVENAVKHGALRRGKEGEVFVGAELVEADDRLTSRLVCTVEDNGPGVSESETRPASFGLYSVRRRLELQYGEKAEFRLESTSLGTRCIVAFPAVGKDAKRNNS